MATTIGKLLLDESLPEDLRDPSRVYDSKGVKELFSQIAEKHPDKYADINKKFNQLSSDVVGGYGGTASFSLEDFRSGDEVKKVREALAQRIKLAVKAAKTPTEKDDAIVKELANAIDGYANTTYDEGLKRNNAFAHQVLSGARGNRSQLMSLLSGPLMVVDHKSRPIPIPLLNSYSEGLTPAQYFAAAYGTRMGSVSVKFATPKAGFLGKQLIQASHRLVVTESDCGTKNGILVDGVDGDNEGALLSSDVGDFKAGTILTPKHLKTLRDKKVVVRSPVTCQSANGVCQKCAGIRERGGFSPIGDNIGVAAAQAITEPIGQAQLSSKHTAGVASGQTLKNKSGLDLVTQMVQVPTTYTGAAAISLKDGTVDKIEDAPQGGKFIYIGNERHWVVPGANVTTKLGQKVEAGDLLSDGLANPADIVRFKGIGEGRRLFTTQLVNTLKNMNVPVHRRNAELLARGLINHVRVTDIDGPEDTVPDDIVEYDRLVRGYQPRFGSRKVAPKQGLGLYLEEPKLHYSIGTRVTPSVASTLADNGVREMLAHSAEPSFAPEMVRAMETISHADDWMVRLGGFHLKKSLMRSVQRGGTSQEHSTSFIPALAKGTEFGKPQGKY